MSNIKSTDKYTEDEIRNFSGEILEFEDTDKAKSGVGQLTTFNMLGFAKVNGKAINDKPDGWYLPYDTNEVAIILETKSTEIPLKKAEINEIKKNCTIAMKKYKRVVGILYNGWDIKVYKNNEEIKTVPELLNKEYYISLFNDIKIDKRRIYSLTKQINNCLHIKFKLKNLYHRMIFTACALVAERYGAKLSGLKDRDYATFQNAIYNTLSKSLEDSRNQNRKLDLLLEVYSEIKMNTTEDVEAINNFIDWVVEISNLIHSDHWNGEDVMAIFFNEFNRYKGKSESGQVFTPDHITSFMYRLIDINKDDVVLDAACGSGAFLVKSMCNMIKEAGGYQTNKAKEILSNQLYGIEVDREIYALACANMLIHKDGKTNIVQYDTRLETACSWMQSKPITKVLMNPPFEKTYGCIDIVSNVLHSVNKGVKCAFILPDKKLENDSKTKVAKILKNHTLLKIIKLPEKTFSEGITTSIFIFEAGVPQEEKEIFTCYIEDDGLETVKNQGRQDIKNRWQEIEDNWVDIIHKQSGHESIAWINPKKCLSFQMPETPFEISKSDFVKVAMDYILFDNSIDIKELNEKLSKKVFYQSNITECDDEMIIRVKKEG